jgi:arylsulfatase
MQPLLRVLAVIAGLSLSDLVAATPASPNVIIIFADDLGYADVGVFGAKGYATPNLDRMASEGVRFTDFHVSSPVCSASRAALLTGAYHPRVGIHGALNWTANHGLNADEMTIAEVVKQRGYATGIAGKWHLGHHPQFLPTKHGFDEYLGLPYSNDMWPHKVPAPATPVPPLPLIEGDQIIDPDVTGEDQATLTTRYTERAVNFIARNKDRPFFFYLAHAMPHVPLYVSDKFRGKSGAGAYGDVMMEIDWSVGEILQALKQHGIDDRTLVIFTSDNGPWLPYGNHAGSSGPFREGKQSAWEGGTRVPFIARWPGRIPADAVQNEPALTIDLLPTIAHLVRAPLPTRLIDGYDIWPLLTMQRGARSPHDAILTWFGPNQLQAVRSRNWKLILPHSYRSLAGRPGGRDGLAVTLDTIEIKTPELYNLATDPGEKTNVADANPLMVEHLLAIAERARVELGDSLTNRTGNSVREPGKLAEAAK